jgi:dTDP-glucose pyrophosphorylase/CBS domain-containing protein
MGNSKRKARLDKVVISPETTISEALRVLDRAGTGVLLLCARDGGLLGTLTDGDIRRAALKNIPFEESCSMIAEKNPLTAPNDTTRAEALRLMDEGRSFVVNQLPLIDAAGQVVDLLLRRDLVKVDSPPLQAVIMAGGFGTRLQPLTKETPKPMLTVGDQPLMEHTINQLRNSGIHNVIITTHYKAEKITSHFGNGEAFGVTIDYVSEDKPLGTAGALSLLQGMNEPQLVINGDILTKMDFRAMHEFHRKHHADLTVGVRQYDFHIPFGVVESDGVRVLDIQEKPEINFLVNAGIYLLEPSVHPYIPKDARFDMTDLVQKLLEERKVVVNFPIVEYWLDIGHQEDYKKAHDDAKNGGLKT